MSNEYQHTTAPAPLFLYIPVPRLILLSIASCGLYEAYWIYKNWRYVKERDRLNISPFWRGMFGIFFCHSLLRRIHTDQEALAMAHPTFSLGSLATGFVILAILGNLIVRVPGATATFIGFVMPSYLCLVPVQNYINSVMQKRSPNAEYYGWSAGHIVCLVIGIVMWALMFMAVEEGY